MEDLIFSPADLAKEVKDHAIPIFSDEIIPEKPKAIEKRQYEKWKPPIKKKTVKSSSKTMLPAKIPKAPKIVGRCVDLLSNQPNEISEIKTTSDEDRYLHHAEIIANFSDAASETSWRKIKVLDRKKLLMNDEEKQDDFLWILLHDIKPTDLGYLHEKEIDYLAQEVSDGFVLIDRKVLKEYICDQLPQNGITTSVPKEAIYRILKIGRRRELKTLVPMEDILHKIPGAFVAKYTFL